MLKVLTTEVALNGLVTAIVGPWVFVHLYGKKLTKPFRKMGHVTILDPDLDTAKARAIAVKDTLKVRT